MTVSNSELEKYAKKPLSERIQDGTGLDKNPNTRLAYMMEPVLRQGFSHPPDEDYIKEVVEARVKELRNTACRDLIQDEIKNDALDVAEMVDYVTNHDPLQLEVDMVVKNISKMLGRVADRRLTQDEKERLDKTAQELVRLTTQNPSADEITKTADGVAQELVRLTTQNPSADEITKTADGVAQGVPVLSTKEQLHLDEITKTADGVAQGVPVLSTKEQLHLDEITKTADGVAQDLVRLTTQNPSADEITKTADRIKQGLGHLSKHDAISFTFWITDKPCMERMVRLASPNITQILNSAIAKDVAFRLYTIMHRYLTGDEYDSMYPMPKRILEQNLSRDAIKECAGEVIQEFLSRASRRPDRRDIETDIDQTVQELVLRATSWHFSKDETKRLADKVGKKLTHCATGCHLSQDDVNLLAGDVIREMMHAIAIQDDRLKKMRQRWRNDMIAYHHVDDPYLDSRCKSWQTHRLVNAHAVGKVNLHKQIIELFKPIMVDLLSGRVPTLKDLSPITNDRQARRTFDNHSAILHVHGQAEDRRIKQFHTPYNTLPEEHTSNTERMPHKVSNFDMRMFADAAYIKRQREFWEGSLEILSEWLRSKQEAGESKEIQNRWLIQHMVNNDIGMHVLFDNLSIMCELRHLPDTTKRKIMYNYKSDIPESEFRSIIDSASKTFKDDPRPEKAGYIYATKSGNGIAVLMDADHDGKPYIMGTEIVPKPYPYTEGYARDAVGELARFAADFSDVVAKFDGLEIYKIPPADMEKRVGELVVEAALSLKSKPDGLPRELGHGEDDAWMWVCKSWVRAQLRRKGAGNAA